MHTTCIYPVFLQHPRHLNGNVGELSYHGSKQTLLCDTCVCDTYSQSESVCGEHKDHGFFSRKLSEFSSLQLQNLWVLHIANSLQQCSYGMGSRVRKCTGFGWLQIKCKTWRTHHRAAVVVPVTDCFWVIAKIQLDTMRLICWLLL